MDSKGNIYRDISSEELKGMKKIDKGLTELTDDEIGQLEPLPKKRRWKALRKIRGTKGVPGAFGGKTKR